METILLVAGFIVAYLIGSIPTAVWVGKWFYNTDVREKGSGNAGATNTIRVLGIAAGIPVIIVDVLKGWFAVWMMRYFIPAGWDQEIVIYAQITAGVMAVIGHSLPVYAGFRGGKGVATLLGMGIALYGAPVWISVVVFVLVLVATGYVSLGSMSAGIVFPFVVVFYYKISNPALIAMAVFAALFILWTHRKNLLRLWKGQENRILYRKNKNDDNASS
ncbi:MAG: glycerol-3-phosphate 1-O-acyltransferase PlsY [Chlorobi bacterium]|nr:glycerol-3-phosphate 1-O-acyltransferase PlsY [Chlorobiota bacterium]